MRDRSLYLKDILQASESIAAFTAGMDYKAFAADDKTISAVVRKLEIIGEAVKQLPEEIRLQHPEIPWKQIAGMRDKLIHFYLASTRILPGRRSAIACPRSRRLSIRN